MIVIDIKIMRRSLEQSENIQKFNERIEKIRQEINDTKTSVFSFDLFYFILIL